MDMGTALVVIAAIGAFYQLRSQKIRAGLDGSGWRLGRRGGQPGPDGQLPGPREQELQQEVAALRERVKVLERIATEGNSRKGRDSRALADEIESLRED